MSTGKIKIGYRNLMEWMFLLLIPAVAMPKMVQLALFLGFSVLLVAFKPGVKWDFFAVLVTVYIGIYAISVIRRIWVSEIPNDRIFSTVNLILIWGIALIIYLYFLNGDMAIDKIARAAFINVAGMFLIACIAALYAAVYGYPNDVNLFGKNLFYWEWTSFRFVGLMDYPTLVVAFEMLMYPWGSMWVRNKYDKRKGLAVAVFTMMGFFPVMLCRSRSGYLLYWLSVLTLPLMGVIRRTKKRQIRGLILFCGVVALVFLVLNVDLCVTIVEKLLLMRKGSQISRSVVYSETWALIREYPILGYGVKIRSSWQEYVLGSHSSYLGFLYKSGIVGTTVLAIGFLEKTREMYRVCLKARSVYAAWIIISISVLYLFFILEDMDGANWLLCVWFAMLGIVGNKNFQEYAWDQFDIARLQNGQS